MLSFLLAALVLGIKHSFDADHLIGVSNILAKSRSLGNTIKMSFSWAIGHMITAVLITILLFTFRDSILSFILDKFEILVAIMLIALGLISLYQARFFHTHKHKHSNSAHEHLHIHLKNNESDHSHKHMFGVGIIHGLASNDELLLLLTVSLGLSSLFDMILGVAVFSLGVVIGMIVFGIILTYPILKIRSEQLVKIVNGTVGVVSIGYGALMIVGI